MQDIDTRLKPRTAPLILLKYSSHCFEYKMGPTNPGLP